MNVMFWVHDIAAALMLLFLAAHVFFAVIAPFSWKTFPSMLIGWMPRGEAEKEHAGWMERLEREQPERGMDESALGAGERASAQETMEPPRAQQPPTARKGDERYDRDESARDRRAA